jgi:hypothetical protein
MHFLGEFLLLRSKFTHEGSTELLVALSVKLLAVPEIRCSWALVSTRRVDVVTTCDRASAEDAINIADVVFSFTDGVTSIELLEVVVIKKAFPYLFIKLK